MTPEEHSQQLQQSVRFGGDHRRSERYSHEESLGQDMWRQLQRVAIPVFSGDKRKYENWKAAFLACIDISNFKPVRDGCSKDIEKFAVLLDVLMVNLLESGRHDELGN